MKYYFIEENNKPFFDFPLSVVVFRLSVFLQTNG